MEKNRSLYLDNSHTTALEVRVVARIVELCERELAFIWLTKGQKPKRNAFYE